MSASLSPISSNLARIFGRGNRTLSVPASDLNALFERIRQRLYSESVPVLASWWLKTVYSAGHNRAWWGELDASITKVLPRQSLDSAALGTVREIQAWIQQVILPRHKAPEAKPLVGPPFRPDLTPEQAAPYRCRVLNEWLPREVAHLLTPEAEFGGSPEGGMPALTVATALERLLLREHFSPATLELLLETEWLSPEYAYPAEIEIFRDIMLALLGRTAAPALPVLPALHLAGGFADAVTRAFTVSSESGDELHVPLDADQAREVFQHDPVRIGSLVVTMDGRCWHSDRLLSGPQSVVIYRPGEHLRIDFTAEHARMFVPWPDAGADWLGEVRLPSRVALFGREWRGRAWERNADRTFLHLEFTGMALPATLEPGHPHPRHLRPAFVEIGWSQVERALAVGVSESIDQIHRTELIHLAHALARLTTCLLRSPSPAGLELCLTAVRYLHSGVAPVYGTIPWRVFSDPARAALLKKRGDPTVAQLISETFDRLPKRGQTSPPRAA